MLIKKYFFQAKNALVNFFLTFLSTKFDNLKMKKKKMAAKKYVMIRTKRATVIALQCLNNCTDLQQNQISQAERSKFR